MAAVIVIVVAGLGLLVVGLSFPRAKAPAPTALPTAKIEDGRPLETPPSPRRVRWLGLISGVALMGLAGYLAALFHSLYNSDFLKLGRPLRVRGRCRLPRIASGAGGHDGARPEVAGLGLWRRVRLGARWHAAARAEQASIPAFDELAEQLRGAGADEALLARCRAAAADEGRHARRCFALARAYSSISWSPGSMPRGPVERKSLATLARESFADGCVGEAVGAAIAQRGAELATDPVIAETLSMIASDEHRHAELAWAVVAFCMKQGGDAVARELSTTADVLDAKPTPGPIEIPRNETAAIALKVWADARSRLVTVQ